MEWFKFTNSSRADPNSQMFTVTKAYDRNGHRDGDIIELDSIVQPCPLSPQFGSKAANLVPGIEVTGENCLEVVDNFWINSFHTKPTYQTVY